MTNLQIGEKARWRYLSLEPNPFMLTYSEVYKNGPRQVGNKAFNVALCHHAGFRTPKGIVLPIEVFLHFVSGNKIDNVFSSFVDRFTGAGMLIVRSSATEEDQSEATFAGQYRSFICENKAISIKKACETCWLSCFSSNVEAYHDAVRNIQSTPQDRAMALLVQELVNATAAGVCFTKDPKNSRKKVFVINAVHGIGSALADDEVVSDHYEFDLNNKSIITITTGKQTHWRSPDNPTVLTPLPQHLFGKAALNSDQIAKVAEMAYKASRLFNEQVDIEWAFENNELFFLQARPITSVVRQREFELWTRDNVADVIPDAVTPLTWSLVEDATNKGFRRFAFRMGLSDKPLTLFKLFDGRTYFNQTAYQSLFVPLNRNKRNYPFLLKIGIKYLRIIFSIDKEVARLEDSFPEALKSLPTDSRTSAIIRLKNHLDKYMSLHILIAGLMDLGFLVIRKAVSKSIVKDRANAVVDGLVTGMGTIQSTIFGEALWDLACLIRGNKGLVEAIMNAPDLTLPQVLMEWGEIYGKKWQEFLHNYDYSSLKEFEIYYPRWAEDPSFIITTLKQYLRQGESIDTNTSKKILARKRIAAESLLLKSIHPVYRLPLKFYISHIRKCSRWRESLKQKLVKIMAEMRREVLQLAMERGVNPADNIFFLSLKEMLELGNHPVMSEVLTETAERKQIWEQQCIKDPYQEIKVYSDGRQLKIPYLTSAGDYMKGLPLSSGKYIGQARVVLDPTSIDSFKWGDILVTHSTNPSWTPLFTLAGAIVTDMGNYLSHGAIVARELGIPAVGNIFTATQAIKTGEMVYVDGDNGIVRKVFEV